MRTGRRGAIVAAVVAAAVCSQAGQLFARDLWLGERNVETVYGRIVDQSGKPIVARVELWYPELGLVTTEMGQALPRGEQYQRDLFHSAYSNEDGWYSMEAIEGDWLVRVTKGPEYEIKETRISVAKGENDGRRIDWTLAHLYDMGALGWYSGDMHHHSSQSDGRQNPRGILEAVIGNDLDFAALTDHNQVAGDEEWASYATYGGQAFLPIPGLEVSTTASSAQAKAGKGWGHMNAIGVSSLAGATDPSNTNIYSRYLMDNAKYVQRCIDETHEKGGLYLLTHSMWAMDWPDGTISTWGEIKNYDAIDVFIGWDLGPHMPTIMAADYADSIFGTAQYNLNTMATQVWFELLNAGNKVAAWASSDSHDVYSVQHTGSDAPVYWRNTSGNARVYVQAADLSWPIVKKALKAGNGFVTSGYYGPLLLVDSGGKAPGETLRPAADGTVTLHYRLLSNRPLKGYADGIRIIKNGKIDSTLPTKDGVMEMEGSVKVKVDAAKDSWIVVEAFGDWPSMAMTNAFYVDPAPFGTWEKTEWKFPAGSRTWNNPFDPTKNVPAVTVPDGPAASPIPLAKVKLGEYRKAY